MCICMCMLYVRVCVAFACVCATLRLSIHVGFFQVAKTFSSEFKITKEFETQAYCCRCHVQEMRLPIEYERVRVRVCVIVCVYVCV